MTLHPIIQLRTYLVALVFLVGGAQAVAQPTPADSSSGEAPTADTRDFVRVEDGRFMIGDAPYAYLGVNFWFGMHLGAESGDRARLERELDRLQAMGVDNLRLLAAAEGPDTEPWRVVPTTQPAAGAYNEAVLEGLDVVLAEMAERDMRGVLVLNNFFQWSGGMAQYVSWVTGEPIPYPHDENHTWDEY
ncbi:MAG: mannanase, partial [Bacteroidota bacterium]